MDEFNYTMDEYNYTMDVIMLTDMISVFLQTIGGKEIYFH